MKPTVGKSIFSVGLTILSVGLCAPAAMWMFTPAQPVGLIVTIQGPDANAPVPVGKMVKLYASGNAVGWSWAIDDALTKDDFEVAQDGSVVSFSSHIPRTLHFALAGNDENGHRLNVMRTVVVGGTVPDTTTRPAVPSTKVTAATYVYERRLGSPPPPVMVAIDKLNRAGIVANVLDQNVISGKGQVPVQHAVALSEAAKAGLPCLVVEYASGAPKVVKAPTTEGQITDAVKVQ